MAWAMLLAALASTCIVLLHLGHLNQRPLGLLFTVSPHREQVRLVLSRLTGSTRIPAKAALYFMNCWSW